VNWLQLICIQGHNGFGNELFFKLTVSISFYESVSRSAMAYLACRSHKGGLRDLFLSVDRVCYTDGIVPYDRSLRRCVRLSLVVACVVIAANVALSACGIFGTTTLQQFQQFYDMILLPGVSGGINSANFGGIIVRALFSIKALSVDRWLFPYGTVTSIHGTEYELLRENQVYSF
jgi:hypothetical protein